MEKTKSRHTFIAIFKCILFVSYWKINLLLTCLWINFPLWAPQTLLSHRVVCCILSITFSIIILFTGSSFSFWQVNWNCLILQAMATIIINRHFNGKLDPVRLQLLQWYFLSAQIGIKEYNVHVVFWNNAVM